MIKRPTPTVLTLALLIGIPATPWASPPQAQAQAPEILLVLKDGRRIPTRRLIRQGGQVILETTRGEVFSVPESSVAAPPLDTIPIQLSLKDGRRIPVLRLARRGGFVMFQTVRGESFSVPESDVTSPPLSSIPRVAGSEPGATQPERPPTAPEPVAPERVAPEPTPEPRAEPRSEPAAPSSASSSSEAEAAAELEKGVVFEPLPDRWSIDYPTDPRIVRGGVGPYHQNVLKGDRPIIGNSTFLVFTAALAAPFDFRRLPVASGISTANPLNAEFFGNGDQIFTSPTGFVSAEIFGGQTAFRPRSWAFKLSTAFNLNYLRAKEQNIANINPAAGVIRRLNDYTIEDGFFEMKLADVSRRFDFVSARAGIQPFVSDFRGFVFSENQLGVRLFGNAASNRFQFNGAYFDLLERDTNSGLITFRNRSQRVFIGNVFRQDAGALGFTVLGSVHHSRDDGTTYIDRNGFPIRPSRIGSARPHFVRPTYLGAATDGHLGRMNLSSAFYYVTGTDQYNPIAGQQINLRAYMAAAEASIDKDWLRFKGSFFFASGDDNPVDNVGKGFDAIYDNTNFIGGVFSFWNRNAIALTQTGVLLKTPFSLLPSLRSAKFEGQSSFVNPGIYIFHGGFDGEITPKLRLSVNASYLQFHRPQTLQVVLFQPVRRWIGIDWGGGIIYRPLLSENIVITAGGAGLLPGSGFDDIYSSTCNVPGCGASSRNLFNAFVELKLVY